MTLIDRQYYTGLVIIAPGQSIDEVITARISRLWKGNVFSRVCLSVCSSRAGPHEIGQTDPLHDLFKLVHLGTPLLYHLDTWDAPWTWTYPHGQTWDLNLLASGQLAFDWIAFLLFLLMLAYRIEPAHSCLRRVLYNWMQCNFLKHIDTKVVRKLSTILLQKD